MWLHNIYIRGYEGAMNRPLQWVFAAYNKSARGRIKQDKKTHLEKSSKASINKQKY